MRENQRESNPDVNTFVPEGDLTDEDSNSLKRDNDNTDIEQNPDEPVIPVPPDAQPATSVKELPGREGPPVGDVDDSPKRIAESR